MVHVQNTERPLPGTQMNTVGWSAGLGKNRFFEKGPYPTSRLLLFILAICMSHTFKGISSYISCIANVTHDQVNCKRMKDWMSQFIKHKCCFFFIHTVIQRTSSQHVRLPIYPVGDNLPISNITKEYLWINNNKKYMTALHSLSLVVAQSYT